MTAFERNPDVPGVGPGRQTLTSFRSSPTDRGNGYTRWKSQVRSATTEGAMNTASALGNEGQARWSLRLFRDFQLSERSKGEKVVLPGKRERVLLAYLALSPNGRQPRR